MYKFDQIGLDKLTGCINRESEKKKHNMATVGIN